MEASGSMYSLKPVTPCLGAIPAVDVMYSLKSYHSAEGGDVNKELDQLEKRQETILTQLRNLKVEVDELLSQSSRPSGASGLLWDTQVTPASGFQKGSTVGDIVISANPQNPPLSLVILHGLLSQEYTLFSSCFTHSSVSNVGDKLKSALGQNNGVNRNSADMALSLIWKGDVSRPTLSSSSTTLEGEAVIARYLARLLKKAASYEASNLAVVTEADYFLDISSDLLYGDGKDQQNVLSALSKKLSTSSYLGGNSVSVVDMVLWSAVHQKKAENLGASVQKWMQSCSKLPQFQCALKML